MRHRVQDWHAEAFVEGRKCKDRCPAVEFFQSFSGHISEDVYVRAPRGLFYREKLVLRSESTCRAGDRQTPTVGHRFKRLHQTSDVLPLLYGAHREHQLFSTPRRHGRDSHTMWNYTDSGPL